MIVDPALRPSHGQQARQDVDKDPPDPGSHPVRLRRPKVNVQHDDGHADTVEYKEGLSSGRKDRSLSLWPAVPYGDEDHGEDEVLSKQRHHQTRGRNDLDDQQEEHVQTNQDGYRQRDLRAARAERVKRLARQRQTTHKRERKKKKKKTDQRLMELGLPSGVSHTSPYPASAV